MIDYVTQNIHAQNFGNTAAKLYYDKNETPTRRFAALLFTCLF